MRFRVPRLALKYPLEFTGGGGRFRQITVRRGGCANPKNMPPAISFKYAKSSFFRARSFVRGGEFLKSSATYNAADYRRCLKLKQHSRSANIVYLVPGPEVRPPHITRPIISRHFRVAVRSLKLKQHSRSAIFSLFSSRARNRADAYNAADFFTIFASQGSTFSF